MTSEYTANANSAPGARIDSNDQAMYDLLPQLAVEPYTLLRRCPSVLTLKDM